MCCRQNPLCSRIQSAIAEPWKLGRPADTEPAIMQLIRDPLYYAHCYIRFAEGLPRNCGGGELEAMVDREGDIDHLLYEYWYSPIWALFPTRDSSVIVPSCRPSPLSQACRCHSVSYDITLHTHTYTHSLGKQSYCYMVVLAPTPTPGQTLEPDWL